MSRRALITSTSFPCLHNLLCQGHPAQAYLSCPCGEKDIPYVCGKCKCIAYCSKECQIHDWLIHRLKCIEYNNQDLDSRREVFAKRTASVLLPAIDKALSEAGTSTGIILVCLDDKLEKYLRTDVFCRVCYITHREYKENIAKELKEAYGSDDIRIQKPGHLTIIVAAEDCWCSFGYALL